VSSQSDVSTRLKRQTPSTTLHHSTHPVSFLPGLCESTEVTHSPAPKAGELNAYTHARSNLHTVPPHRVWVHTHDSACLRRRLVLSGKHGVVFLRYSDNCVTHETVEPSSVAVLSSLLLGGERLVSVLTRVVREGTLNVEFGSAALFTPAFTRTLETKTNTFQITGLFQSRKHRCLLERVVSTVRLLHYPDTPHLCGDIFQHPEPLRSTDPATECGLPVVKVWQGR
jgi:hypothetical protein